MMYALCDLSYDPRTNFEKDNTDNFFDVMDSHPFIHEYPWQEISQCNADAILKQFNKVKTNCSAILEIGLDQHGYDLSSTKIFHDNKNEDTIWIGIDILSKVHLNKPDQKCYTIMSNSTEYENNVSQFAQHGVDKFDFIFIDGNHSLLHVMHDWAYTQLLNPGGIIGLHDVSIHPGPVEFLKALDRSKWHVEENCCPRDWGVAFCWKI